VVVPGRVERYRMTEIAFDSEENFDARSSLVDARKVTKGIAEVVHVITPVTNWSVTVCHDSTNAVLNATDSVQQGSVDAYKAHWCRQMFFSARTSLKFLSRTKESKSVLKIRISRDQGSLWCDGLTIRFRACPLFCIYCNRRLTSLIDSF
jgi:hypothetical protein